MKKTTRITKQMSERYINARKHFDNITQLNIATLAGVTQPVVNSIEVGNVQMPSIIYTDYLVSRGINFEYLMCRSDQMLISKEKDFNLEKENSDLRRKLEQEKLDKEKLEKRISTMDSTIEYLMGELERLKKERSQIQTQTYPMTSPEGTQTKSVNFKKGIIKQPNLGLIWNENYGISGKQATN